MSSGSGATIGAGAALGIGGRCRDRLRRGPGSADASTEFGVHFGRRRQRHHGDLHRIGQQVGRLTIEPRVLAFAHADRNGLGYVAVERKHHRLAHDRDRQRARRPAGLTLRCLHVHAGWRRFKLQRLWRRRRRRQTRASGQQDAGDASNRDAHDATNTRHDTLYPLKPKPQELWGKARFRGVGSSR